MNDLFEEVLKQALDKAVSDIHISKLDQNIIIQFRKKGKLELFKNLSLNQGLRFMNYIKFEAGLEQDYRYTLKTGSFEYSISNRVYRFRVSSIPTLNGDSLVIRLLDSILFNHIEELTFDKHVIDKLKDVVHLDHGLVVICGPTGVGKSTTLHVLLKEIYQKTKGNIITIEDPIEMLVKEFTQIQISNKIDYDIALRQILRHDPDVLMIGELRDSYSAKLAVRCALTGILVITTIHSNDALSSLKRLKNLQVDENELDEVMQIIFAQRLLYEPQTTALIEYYDYKEKELYDFNKGLALYEKL